MAAHVFSALLGGVIAVGISWIVLEVLSHLGADGGANKARYSTTGPQLT